MKKKSLAGLLLAASALAVSVHAQQVVSYFADVSSLAPGSPQILQLPRFDSRLGQLTAVQLTFTGDLWQSAFAENRNGTAANYDLSTTARLSLMPSDGSMLFPLPAFTLHRSGSLAAFDGQVNFADTSGVTFSQNGVINGIYVDPDLVRYVGTGVVDFHATVLSQSWLNSDANVAQGTLLSSAVSLGVDYTFTSLAAIPEPSTYAALMGGVMLLVAWRRRNRPVAV